MLNFETNAMALMHRHGEDWAPMEEVEHSAVDHDPERRLLRGERVFRCKTCDDEIRIVSSDEA
ncbi:MAG TPA: hypothetical protein VEW45_07390 [Candidatus Dormibacteraeota bacterium]|nr:hypothetical protein [Candidatus Dormibacteraeota bacterium]